MSACKACGGTGVIPGANHGGRTEQLACDCSIDETASNRVHPIFQPIIDFLAPPRTGSRKHVESASCWCNPTLNYTNPETGAQHWVHHEPN